MLDAATALLIWGGRIVIISTHNGKANPFNGMIKDIRAGRYGDKAQVYRATFDDAVANGLYERMCFMTSQTPTAAGKEDWYKSIRNAYGPRKAQMREELDAIPRDGNGVCLPGVWIEDAMRSERPVLRLILDDDFARQPPERREAYVADWIARYLKPVLDGLKPDWRHVLGQDFARHRDFSEITPYALLPNLGRFVPFVVELHKVPTRQQQQILWHIIDHLPRFGGASMDATGNGETLAEYTADQYGHQLIHQIKLSRTWYGAWMPKMVQAFEDGILDIPRDENLASDLRAIEDVDGIPMVPDVRRKDLKDPDLYRHGDFAVSLCLAHHASLNLGGGIEFTSLPGKNGSASNDDDDDDGPGYAGLSRGGW
ncbi:hypothetical protein D9M71_202180 [compost metagenome]